MIVFGPRLQADQYASQVILDMAYEEGFKDASPLNLQFTASGAGAYTTTADKAGGAASLRIETNCLQLNDASVFNLGASDFTIEFWIKKIGLRNDDNTGNPIFAKWQWPSAQSFWLGYTSTQMYLYGTSLGVIGCAPPSLNVWENYAWCRQGSTCRVFKNGQVVNTVSVGTAAFTPTSYLVRVGGSSDGIERTCNAFIDSLRVTKAARYLANYTKLYTK